MKTVTAHLKHIVGTYTRAALLGTAVITTAFIAPTAAHAQVFFSVNVAPPVIPVYEQPLCPGDGYIWTPGYWAYGDDGYYWVDGAWVEAPYEGALWTPGYWGYNNGAYLWNAGYWGPTIGYYGGINYGFGYFGSGFYGGRWDRGHFFYNTAYNRIDGRRFHNVYDDNSHGGTWARPGGRSFDPHPRMDEHREAGFNNNRGGFNQDNRGGFNQNQPNRGNDNRGNFNQQGNRPAFQGGQSQQRSFAAAPITQPTQNQPNQNRPVYNGGNGGNSNPGRGFSSPQQGFNQPQQQQQQPHSFVQMAPPQQRISQPQQQQQERSFSQPQRSFSPPVQQTRPAQVYSAPQQQQHFNAPANNGGGAQRGGGGGSDFHGGNGGHR